MNEIIQSSIGGLNVTTTIEGRGRYPVNVRYARELRGDVESLKRVLVPVSFPDAQPDLPTATAPGTAHVPLSQLADIRIVNGAYTDQERGGDAHRVHLYRLAPRPMRERTSRRRKASGLFQGSRRLPHRMERRLRAHPDHAPAPQDRHPPHHPPDPHHHLHEHQVLREDGHRPPGRPLFPDQALSGCSTSWAST